MHYRKFGFIQFRATILIGKKHWKEHNCALILLISLTFSPKLYNLSNAQQNVQCAKIEALGSSVPRLTLSNGIGLVYHQKKRRQLTLIYGWLWVCKDSKISNIYYIIENFGKIIFFPSQIVSYILLSIFVDKLLFQMIFLSKSKNIYRNMEVYSYSRQLGMDPPPPLSPPHLTVAGLKNTLHTMYVVWSIQKWNIINLKKYLGFSGIQSSFWIC